MAPKQFNWSFERRVMRRVIVTASGCWEWQGSRMKNGYGQIGVGGVKWAAHRYAYTELVGEMPDSLDLDHLCRNRCCINPLHLEPVTRSENLKRGMKRGEHNRAKTHCPNGHEYSGENLYIHPSGRRNCRACTNERARRRKYNG